LNGEIARVQQKEFTRQALAKSPGQFKCLGRLHGSNDSRQRRKNAQVSATDLV
jgi:hypothetical protein